MTQALFPYLLTLGDDSLVLGQRLCEWSGIAPTIEVDLGLSNLALDLIGQATLLLDLAGETEGRGRDADALAFRRDAEDFRNSLLVEQANGDFAETMARQLLFSTYQRHLYDALSGSTDQRISEIAAKAVKEVCYHAGLATDWVIRLGQGTEESHARMAEGMDGVWRFVDDLFTMDEGEQMLTKAGIAADKSALRPQVLEELGAVLKQAGLEDRSDALPWQVTGGRHGRHSEQLGRLLAEMQVLPRAHPEAVW